MVEWICALVFVKRTLLCLSPEEVAGLSPGGRRKPAEAQGLSAPAAKVCRARTGLVLGEDESGQAVVRLVGGLLLPQIPGDEVDVPLCIPEGPFPAGSGWPQPGSVWNIMSPSFWFFFKQKQQQQQQKQAENKNLTSGQARILFWKREVCASIPS